MELLDTIEMLSKRGYSSDLLYAVENYLQLCLNFPSRVNKEKRDSLSILYTDRLKRYISNDEFCKGIRILFEPLGHRAPSDVPQPNSKP